MWLSSDKLLDKLRISENQKLLKPILEDIEKNTSNKKHVTGETGPEAETLQFLKGQELRHRYLIGDKHG